ncbi:MAG: methyltransferase domain-containing protein [Thermoleophilaceae bacterium]
MTEPEHSSRTAESPQAPADYRARLYESYVRTHTGGPSERSLPTLEHDIVRHVPDGPGTRVLDVGCGAGELVDLLVRSGRREVKGIDVSAEQVALARSRGLSGIEQADLIDYLGRTRESFDAIVAVDVLEHFDKPEVLTVLEAIATGLRPGGRLVARVPNAEGPFGARTRYADFTHGTAFTHRSVRQVLLATGFSAVEVYPTEPVAHGLPSLGRWVLWKVIALLVRLYLLVETGVFGEHVLTQNLVAVAYREGQPERSRSASAGQRFLGGGRPGAGTQ